MKMKKLVSKVLAGTMAFMMATTGVQFSLPITAHADEPITTMGTFIMPNSENLGSVNSYAVFSNDYVNANHMEGNIATALFHPTGQYFGVTGNVLKYVNPDENYFYFEQIDNISQMRVENTCPADYFIFPDTVTFDKSYNNYNGIMITNNYDGSQFLENLTKFYKVDALKTSDTTYQIDFAAAMNGLLQFSNARKSEGKDASHVLSYSISSDGNNDMTIDLTAAPAGECYVDIPVTYFQNTLQVDGHNVSQSSAILINGVTANKTLVMNITGLDNSTDYDFDHEVKFDGIPATGYGEQGGYMLINLGEYSGKATFKKTDGGVILAPNAYVLVSGSSHNGSVFANMVKNENAQIHLNPYLGAPKVNPVNPPTPAIDVTFSKIDTATTTELKGAKLTLEMTVGDNNLKGSEVVLGTDASIDSKFDKSITWISGSTPTKIKSLPVGTYRLTELAAPNGYQVASSIVFKVTESGLTTESGDAITDNKIVMEDAPIADVYFNVSKRKISGSGELPGATLQIKQGDDVVCEWVSGSSEKTIYVTANGNEDTTDFNIAPGAYTLVEITAPMGYTKAEAIAFTLSDTGEVKVNGSSVNGRLIMKDKPIPEFEFSKVDGSGSPIEGASFELREESASGSIVTSWTSTTQKKTISTSKLEVGKQYVIVESFAPAGYNKAANISFKVADDGSLTNVTGAEAYTAASGSTKALITMKDTVNSSTFGIIKKNTSGKILLGGEYVILASDGLTEVTPSWTSSTKEQLFTFDSAASADTSDFILGSGTYLLREKKAPVGYLKNADATITIDATGNITVSGTGISASGKHITIKDSVIPKITFTKYDSNGVKLSGATFGIYEGNYSASKTPIVRWTSAERGIDGTYFKLGTTYVLHEISAPAGYAKSADIKFTIKEDGSLQLDDSNYYAAQTNAGNRKIGVVDTPIVATFSKKAVSGTNELPGATLKITPQSGTKVDLSKVSCLTTGVDAYSATKSQITWKTKEGVDAVKISKLPAGKYIYTETAAPVGYAISTEIKFTVNEDGTVVVTSGSSSTSPTVANSNLITMEDAAIPNLTVNKVKLSSGGAGTYPLEGATLKIYKGDVSGVQTPAAASIWDNVSNKYANNTISGSIFEVGKTYTLREEASPNGYAIASDIVFKIGNDGKIETLSETAHSTSDKATNKIVMLDAVAAQDIKISKQTVGGAELSGATLSLHKGTKDGALVGSSWVSDGSQKTISGSLLEVGQTYVLVEDAAPAGYAITSTITFKIGADGKVDTSSIVADATSKAKCTNSLIVMVDNAIADISISKKAIVGDQPGANELEGATLSLYKNSVAETNKVVDSWVGSSTPKAIPGDKLEANTTYILVEDAAPAGYAVTSNITFKINSAGELTDITSEATHGSDASARKIVMLDKATEATFSKQDTDKANVELPGATITLTINSNTTTLDGVERVSGPAITKSADGKTITWTSTDTPLKLTKLPTATYTMKETGAPNGYKYATDITFAINKDGKIANKEGNVVIMKDEAIAPVSISKVSILDKTKELPGAKMSLYEGTVATGTKIDEWTSSDKPHEIPAATFVEGKTYTIHELIAPNGYNVATDITFEIGEGGAIKNVSTDSELVDYGMKLIKMVDTPCGTFSFSKQSLGGHLIKGAKLCVVPLEGQNLSNVGIIPESGGEDIVIKSDSITWISTYKPLGLIAVPDGKYLLKEIDVPLGYIRSYDESTEQGIVFEAKNGILTKKVTDVFSAEVSDVELIDLYDPNTTTVSVYSRYYNVDTFDPKHEDEIASGTPTADNTEFTIYDENGAEAKIVKKTVKREEIDNGIWVTVVTFEIDTTNWPIGTERTYTIKETIAPTAKENGGYKANDELMTTTYKITKKQSNDNKVTYDRVWSNNYKKDVKYDEFNPEYIPVYSHTKPTTPTATNTSVTTNTTVTTTSTVTPPPATDTSVTTGKKSPKTGESSLPFVLFGGSMTALLLAAVAYTIARKKREK